MNSKAPDRVHVRKQDIEEFRIMIQERDSPFFKRDNKDVFIMAMILGFNKNHRIPLDKKEGFIRVEYLSTEEKSLIKAIAIHAEGGLKVLLDKQKVYSIAEEYAAGGMQYLKEAIFDKQFGSYVKRLESELVETYEELQLNKEG